MIREPIKADIGKSGEKYLVSEYKKNENREYEVVFKNGFSAVFSAEEFLKYDLFDKEECNRRSYAELVREVNYGRCRAVALKQARSSPKTVAMIAAKLKSIGFDAETVERVTGSLLEEGELDDALFADRFAREKAEAGKMSADRIVRELEMKGVPGDIAAAAVEKYCVPDFETAKNLAEKKAKTGASREKTMRYLLGRGFRMSVVIRAVDGVFGESGTGLSEWDS
jgi:regulatory protein